MPCLRGWPIDSKPPGGAGCNFQLRQVRPQRLRMLCDTDKLARLADCTPSTVCKRVADLCRWGYLKAKRQENRRRVQYKRDS